MGNRMGMAKRSRIIQEQDTLVHRLAKLRKKSVSEIADFVSYHLQRDSKETVDALLYRAIAGRSWGDRRSDVELLLRDSGNGSAVAGILCCLRFSA